MDKYNWTYEQYLQAPDWAIDMFYIKLDEEAKKEKDKQRPAYKHNG